MKSTHIAVAAVTLLWFAAGGTDGGETRLNGCDVRIPDGFTVELVAKPPLVTYPICGDFDERGRLYVAEASGSRDWNKPQPDETRHRVLRLVDTDGDGWFDERTVFATFEMLAQGTMWLDGSLYVAAAPIIWKLTDHDGDGVAERREKWLETQAVTGCLNDLRGPYLGPDGWIHWCKGPAPHTYQVDGKPWTTAARHIIRRHPQRQDVEQLMVGGMDNLIEVAFSRAGDRFVTATNIHFLGQPRKDGILHAVPGGVHPKDIAPVYGFPWSGPQMLPEMTAWGATSPCGLARYESSQFGNEYRDNLFSCLFSGHKVVRHILQADGATFQAREEDFLASDDVEFHPTDVLEDADGSLLVIETGGWYLHCCPSSTFYRPERHGAIYRIRRAGAHQIDDPRGRTLDWAAPTVEDLARRLADGRPAVRQRAIHELGKRGEQAVPALRAILGAERGLARASTDARLAAVWAATRIDHESARQVVRLAVDDADETVRHAAITSISLSRDRQALPQLLHALRHPSAGIRRVAAESLGRIGDASAVAALLEAASGPADRFLEHAITFALIQIADPNGTQAGLTGDSVNTRRAAMIALDQMPGGSLDPKWVLAELGSPDPKMQEAAWWLASRHARQWGGLLADKVRARLQEDSSDSDRQTLVARLAAVARAPEFSAWIAAELTRAGVSAETQIVLLQAMADASPQSAAADAGRHTAESGWIEAMLGLLDESANAAVLAAAVAALGKQPPIPANEASGRQLQRTFDAGLLRTGLRADLRDDTRLGALSAIRTGSIEGMNDRLLEFLLARIGPEQPLHLRTAAADVLSRSRLTAPQLLRLAGSLKNLAAAELNQLLGLFGDQKSDDVGLRLVASLEASASATTLSAFRLKNCLAGFGPDVQDQARPLFERLERAQAEQLSKAHRILEVLSQADPHRGMQVFHDNKAACTACHKTVHVGGAIGPNLRGIGQRRSERDLVESILFPSASMVQGYETWTVLTRDGGVFNGVIAKDSPDELVLSAGPDKTARIARQAVEELARSNVSIMPIGLDKILTDQQLADLVAYLKSLK